MGFNDEKSESDAAMEGNETDGKTSALLFLFGCIYCEIRLLFHYKKIEKLSKGMVNYFLISNRSNLSKMYNAITSTNVSNSPRPFEKNKNKNKFGYYILQWLDTFCF